MKKSDQVQRKNVNNIGMFDLSRGLLLLLVVLGHSVSMFFEYKEAEVEVWLLLPLIMVGKVFIYGLIPMFFIMSGYGFRKQNMKKCVKSQLRYLSKPYLCVAIAVTVIAVLKKIVMGRPVLDALRYQSLPFLLGVPSYTKIPSLGLDCAPIGFMWFFVTLTLAWIGLNLILQVKNEVLRVVIIVLLALLGVQMPAYAFTPFCYAQVLCCIAYLYLGYRIKKSKLLVRKIPLLYFVISGIVLCGIVFFGNIDISQNMWKLNFLDYIASCIAGILMFKIFVSFDRFEGKIAEFLRLLGRNSIYILCVHAVEDLVFPWEYVERMTEGDFIASVLTVVVIRAIIIFVSCFIINKIVRWKRVMKRG